MQRGHVKVAGVVGSTADAQQIASDIGKSKCVKDAKIAKVTQQVNSDRQKYTLEFDVRCVDDAKKKKEGAAGEKPAEPGDKGGAP
jgi:hypothetical protein